MQCCAGQETDREKQPTSEVDWEHMRLQVAAAVLELLVNASLMMQPIDADALTYVYKTARLLQVILVTRPTHHPGNSMLQCKGDDIHCHSCNL